MTASLIYNTAERPAAYQGQLREQMCFSPWHNTAFRLSEYPIGVENLKLGMYITPVLPPSGPLFCYVHRN